MWPRGPRPAARSRAPPAESSRRARFALDESPTPGGAVGADGDADRLRQPPPPRRLCRRLRRPRDARAPCTETTPVCSRLLESRCASGFPPFRPAPGGAPRRRGSRDPDGRGQAAAGSPRERHLGVTLLERQGIFPARACSGGADVLSDISTALTPALPAASPRSLQTSRKQPPEVKRASLQRALHVAAPCEPAIGRRRAPREP